LVKRPPQKTSVFGAALAEKRPARQFAALLNYSLFRW
jgi:hypothetical protein